MPGPPKPPSLPQVKLDFNKAAGNIPPTNKGALPPPKPKPPLPPAAIALPVPGRPPAHATKTPPPAAAVQAKAAAAKAASAKTAAAKAPPKKPLAPGGIKTAVQPGVAFNKAAAPAAAPKGGVQATAQAQAQARALQMKRDFAKAATQRKAGKGKTQEKKPPKGK